MRKCWFYLLALNTLIACSSGPVCENSDIAKFDSFLGIDASTRENELTLVLGDFTGGYYSEDNTQFIYNFYSVPDAPVSVVVNATTSKVETVMMEVLTMDEEFQKDLQEGIERFKIDECESRFFGMTYDQLIEALGEPTNEETLTGNIKQLTYSSPENDRSITFKFYPEQDNICSTVIMNWFKH